MGQYYSGIMSNVFSLRRNVNTRNITINLGYTAAPIGPYDPNYEKSCYLDGKIESYLDKRKFIYYFDNDFRYNRLICITGLRLSTLIDK